MAFAITQTCCADASCVAACPVNCIHPTPDEPGYATADMLYIDPRSCIDCGACADACPVDAIFPVESLTGPLAGYDDVNAAWYAEQPAPGRPDGAPIFHEWGPPAFDRAIPATFPALDVAVVGSGPAGMYTVQDLLLHTPARVTLYDRLPEPGGLVRFGVAPDHPSTKRIDETFARYRGHHRLRLRLGTEIGRDVDAAELARRHDAVIYAVGAADSRRLGVPGEELPAVLPATTVVGWYNGHPEVPAGAVDTSVERVAVVGSGNVALDVARILTSPPDALADSAIAPSALERLRSGSIREVVVLARRGPDRAAYTRPEITALARARDVELVVDDHDPRIGPAIDTAAPRDTAGLLQGVRRERIDWAAPPPAGVRRIVLRFHAKPEEITGDGVRLADATTIPAGLVVRAIGQRGRPVPGLPFDEARGVVPNDGGRVQPGTYVVGWIKRGPSGGIGANRACARQTVSALLDDAVSGRIGGRPRSGKLARLLRAGR